MWGIGCFLIVVAALLVGFFALLSWFITTVFGSSAAVVPVVLIGLLVVLVLIAVGSGFRRFAAPVGDLIDASGRVEAGDFTTRVEEVGPREIRRLARAFNAMSAQLDETQRQRRSALADVSHELRTPLTVIQGNIEAILDGVYPADAEHLQPILEEIHVMERLIEDLRTLSLVEADALVLHREPTDISALLHEVAAGYQPHAEQSAVRLTVDAAEGLRLVSVDPARVREILANLFTNAIRHTPREGSVEVSAAMAEDAVAVIVRDTGSGMTPEQLDRAFDRFYRAADSPGSGLGLPIAHDLVQAHGGVMSATSEVGRGTTVRFTLPISPEPTRAAAFE